MLNDGSMVRGGSGVYDQSGYPQAQGQTVQPQLPPGFMEEMAKRGSSKKGGVGAAPGFPQTGAIGGAANGAQIGPSSLAVGGQGAGGGMGQAAAAAGPWAALFAAIAANETYQNKSGNRPNDFKEHMGDIVTGKVLERDAERYLGSGASKVLRLGTPSGIVRGTKDLASKIRGWV